MRIIGHHSARLRPHYVAAAPLTNEAKVAAINTLLLKYNKAPVNYVPPSQIVLTPFQPYQGPNSLVLNGNWTAGSHHGQCFSDRGLFSGTISPGNLTSSIGMGHAATVALSKAKLM
jgi:hypothetical protein